ncbi:MAG: NADH-quinone oxidoreductase subunit NuoE [Deltaproteobacteria bacterium]|nr:NADH-quinone oxidoreductase subunit NuoE [Deltaproteobacteria bacterium]
MQNALPGLYQCFGKGHDSLIPILQGIQNRFKYIPKEVISIIADDLLMYESDIYGVITFYTQFRLNPVGEHIIKICKGTACHVGGAETVAEAVRDILKIDEQETSKDQKFTLEYVACLGCCSLAPVMMIDDKVYAHLTNEKIKKILEEY